MQSYTFINKFVITNRKVAAAIIIKLILGIAALVAIIQFAISGLSVLSIAFPVFIVSLMLPRGAPTFEEHASAVVSFDSEGIKIRYTGLDRHDKLGKRNEEYIINPSYVRQIRYSQKNHRLSIVSKALIKLSTVNGGRKERDFRQRVGSSRNILYLTDDIREPLLNAVKSVCETSPFLQKVN